MSADRKPPRRHRWRGLLIMTAIPLFALVAHAQIQPADEPTATDPPEAASAVANADDAATPAAASADAKTAEPGKPDEVVVGAYLNDIQNLDLKTHTFAADLYLWFRWKNTEIDPLATLEFNNPSELWGHTRTNDYEKPEKLDGDELYNVVHVQGRFSCKLPLFNYPFDRQTLFIEFEDSTLAATAMRYVPDKVPLKVNPSLRLPGFDIGAGQFLVSTQKYETNFGDTRVHGHDAFSRGRVELKISRPTVPQAIKMLLPVLCVVICASMMFLFGTQHVDSRVELGITSLLTVVALQMTMNDNLPEVAYLVLIDKVYIATYLFVIFAFSLVVREARMIDKGDHEGADRMNRRGLYIGVGAYTIAMLLLLVPTLMYR